MSRHVLGIDDGPMRKFEDRDVLVVGVVMAGGHLVEGVLTTRLPIDGDGATEALARWIRESRFHPLLRAIFLDGITIAGLSVLDLPLFHELAGLPVVAVTRRPPTNDHLEAALLAARFPERVPLLKKAEPAYRYHKIHFECAGLEPDKARDLLDEQMGRSHLPEAVRIAHLVARGVTLGESRGRP